MASTDKAAPSLIRFCGAVHQTKPVSNFFCNLATDMPAIVASSKELRAALQLAGIKTKPAQVDRAWLALASGESRSNLNGLFDVYGGVLLALKVAMAEMLRNPLFSAFLAVTIAMVCCHTRWLRTEQFDTRSASSSIGSNRSLRAGRGCWAGAANRVGRVGWSGERRGSSLPPRA